MAAQPKPKKKVTFSITLEQENKDKLILIARHFNRSQSGSLDKLIRDFNIPK